MADPNRFGEIFKRHYGAILGYVRRRVGADLAEDLAVETFAVAMRRVGSYDPREQTARPWLFGIATNLLRRHRRSERRRLAAYARTGQDPIGLLDPGFDAADDRVHAQTTGPVIAHALADLRREEREVLLLYAWADLTYAEIARALDVPVGTVRSRLARARQHVRELLIATGQVLERDHQAERSNDE